MPHATATDTLQKHLGSPVVPQGHTSCPQWYQPGVGMWWQCCRRRPRLRGPCGAAADRDYRVAVPLQQPCQQHRGALASLKWIRCLKYPTSISVVWVVLSFFFIYFFFHEISNETVKDKPIPRSSETMDSPRDTSGSSTTCPSLSDSSLNHVSRTELQYSLPV